MADQVDILFSKSELEEVPEEHRQIILENSDAVRKLAAKSSLSLKDIVSTPLSHLNVIFYKPEEIATLLEGDIIRFGSLKDVPLENLRIIMNLPGGARKIVSSGNIFVQDLGLINTSKLRYILGHPIALQRIMNHIHAKFEDFDAATDRNCELLLENSSATLILMQRANVTIKSLGKLPSRILQELLRKPENASTAIHEFKLSAALLKACLIDHLIPLIDDPSPPNYQEFLQKTTLRIAQQYKEKLESAALGLQDGSYGHIYPDMSLLDNDKKIATENRPKTNVLTPKDFAAIEQSVFGRALGAKEPSECPDDPFTLIKSYHGWTW